MRLLIVPVCLIVTGCQTSEAPRRLVPYENPQNLEQRCANLVHIVGNRDVSPSIRAMAFEAARNNECLGPRPPIRVEIR